MSANRLVVIWLLTLLAVRLVDGESPKHSQSVHVLLYGNGGCTTRVVAENQQARENARGQTYLFTLVRVAKASLQAKRHVAACELVLGLPLQTPDDFEFNFFFTQSIHAFIEAAHAIAHNNVIPLDVGTIITGSFDLTNAADGPIADDLLIIKGHSNVAEQCVHNRPAHCSHSHDCWRQQLGGAASREPPNDPENDAAADHAKACVTATRSKHPREGSNCFRQSKIPMKLSAAKRRHASPLEASGQSKPAQASDKQRGLWPSILKPNQSHENFPETGLCRLENRGKYDTPWRRMCIIAYNLLAAAHSAPAFIQWLPHSASHTNGLSLV